MSFLGGKVEYVVTSLLLTTTVVSISVPFTLPFILGEETPGAWIPVAVRVGTTIFAPIVTAIVLRRLVPGLRHGLKQCQTAIFFAWIATITVICSNASNYIRTEPGLSNSIILEMGAIALAVCVVNFSVGYLFGGKRYRHECSQSLGQKNTSITIFLALEFANPLVALGPTLYALWHNLWNAWQLKSPPEKTGDDAPSGTERGPNRT